MSDKTVLPRNTNQALGLGQYAVDFMAGRHGSGPSQAVLQRTKQFHTDSVLCGLSALAQGTSAPTVLRAEALGYSVSDPGQGAFCFASNQTVMAEKAIVANCAAVREWDSNGTNFGYNPGAGHTAGEFGHNDFYPVVVAACQQRELSGTDALRAMVLLDEIRGRLAEVFSLKSYKIDHVVHGAIASAATYGALMGATSEQIESAVGMFVAHYVPWRAIRAGKQLSDSKGASAAISTEAAILCMKRSLAGFVGPRDIFRNPEALFRQFEPTGGDSPFDLILSHSGDDFAVMGMHFKLGLYEHQSAGALQCLIDVIHREPSLLQHDIRSILIKAYEPAFGIIGDPAKRDPHTRQSADHSMVYIVASMLRKAIEAKDRISLAKSTDEIWEVLMLLPQDFSLEAINNPETRALMAKVAFEHGGEEYDARYPDGIPTSLCLTDHEGNPHESGLVMYPAGHARNEGANLKRLLDHKWGELAKLAFPPEFDAQEYLERLNLLEDLDHFGLATVYDVEIAHHHLDIPSLRVQIETLKDITVVTMRHTGAYHKIGETFDRLSAWASQISSDPMETLAVYYDDPSRTPEDELQSDACLVVPDGFNPPNDEVNLLTIMGGEFATCQHVGSYADLGRVWEEFFDEIEPQLNRQPDGITFEWYRAMHPVAITDLYQKLK